MIADLYKLHASAVYWAAFGVLHDESTAMDVMQTVFVRALEHEATLAMLAPAQARAWLFKAAKHASIDLIRKQKREILTEEPEETQSQDVFDMPEDVTINNETRAYIRVAIGQLPEKYRQPIVLYYFAHMQQNEIAQYLDINDSTLRTRLKRAKTRLYEAMREGGVLHG